MRFFCKRMCLTQGRNFVKMFSQIRRSMKSSVLKFVEDHPILCLLGEVSLGFYGYIIMTNDPLYIIQIFGYVVIFLSTVGSLAVLVLVLSKPGEN